MMAQVTVDNAGEIFGDKTSIADLAQFSFAREDSNTLHIYRADEILQSDWRNEIREVEMEYALGISATFKDGSKLHVSAWGDCCEGVESTYRCPHCGQGAQAA